MLAKLTKKYKLSALVLGLLSASAFPPFYCLPIFIIALVCGWKLTDRATSLKQSAAVGYWYGFGLFAAGFSWVGNALLIDVQTFGWLYPITLIASGAFFGLFTVLPFMAWHILKSANVVAKVLSFAASWVLCEWIRSFLFTGFPWNMLGSVLTFNVMYVQSASIWGTYGLSFWFLVWCGAVYLIANRQWRTGLAVFITLPLLFTVYGKYRLNHYDKTPSEITVRLVQPSIPQSMKWNRQMLENNFAEYIELSQQSGLEKVDFVVWGETATPFDLAYDDYHREQVLSAIPSDGFLITGLVRFDEFENRPFNSMYVLNRYGDIKAFYDKSHLVPFGEYIPLRRYLPEWIQPVAGNIADFGVGKKLKNIELKGFPKFGALICYEIIFPDAVINRQDKPSWLVVLTNDGWYGDSAGPYQHLAAAQLRAVEEGVTIVRSANSGISAVIYPTGEILELIPLFEKGYIDVYLPLNLKLSTAYNHCANSVFLLSMVLILLITLLTYNGLIKKNYAKKS